MNNLDNDIEMFGKFFKALEILENCKEFAYLIPEVRTNLVYMRADAKGINDVIGIDGRITSVNGMPHASGKPKFGASSHMARFIIAMNKYDPSIRAGINFANDPKLAKWLEKYCESKGWVFCVADRSDEPDEIKDVEGASMSWKVEKAIKSAGGKVPKICYETGAVGKEPVSVLVGKDPIEVVEEVCTIARLYFKESQIQEKIGKIDLNTFNQTILNRLGKKDDTVLVPPMTGVDAGVIDIGNNKVLVIAEDPIFPIPKLAMEMLGWATVHIGASDVAVMGVKPRYMTYTLLMPPKTEDEIFTQIVDSIHRTAEELDIAVVGGHTGYYPSVISPVIGGITVFGITEKSSYVTSSGAKPDDDIILTKGPAIEATAILAILYEKFLLNKYPSELVESAKSMCNQMTVVKDALIAMEAGGVSAMHDATEGGVIGGLFEIANASQVGMEVDESLFIYPDEVKMVCEALEIDPVASISEGSLLITVEPKCSDRVLNALKNSGINASIIGKVLKDEGIRTMKRLDGKVIPLAIPEQDPFWTIFFKGLS